MARRKQKKYHFLYKTTNMITEKFYLGMHSTDNLEDGYLGSGKILRYSLRKYGEENHKIERLEFLENRKELIEKEKEIINEELLKDPMCMNLMLGGEGGFISEEQQRNRSIAGGKGFAKKLKNDPEFREKHNNIKSERFKKLHEEGKIKYDTFTGKTHSEESRKIIGEKNSKRQKGKNNSQFGTCWITNGKESKKINKKELNIYLQDNWRKGRK